MTTVKIRTDHRNDNVGVWVRGGKSYVACSRAVYEFNSIAQAKDFIDTCFHMMRGEYAYSPRPELPTTPMLRVTRGGRDVCMTTVPEYWRARRGYHVAPLLKIVQ